jgi:hypothetical protein
LGCTRSERTPVRKSKTGHAERAAHVAGLVVMLALFVLAKAGVIPMWVVTFGLSWTQLAMLTIGLISRWPLGRVPCES